MPNQEVPLSFDFSDAPGGDQTLDDIFNLGETDPSTTSTTTETQQTHTEPDTFLKNATGTVVYKTADDAIAGIEHKDALIAQLRQEALARTGQDPIKPKVNTEPDTYIENPKKYFEDIRNAKTEQEVLAVQGRYIQEQLAPYAPLIAGMARSQAVEQVASEVPEIQKFLHSEEYKQTLEKYPLLKNSINIGETNPQASGDLAQLYRMAYSASAGMNLSKIVQTNSREAVAETRPTVSSTTTLAPGTTRTTPPSLETSEGRKSIIETQKQRGVLDLRF